MLYTLLIIILVLALVGGLPQVGLVTHPWGYGPSGGLGLVVTVLIILLLLGRI